MFEEKKKTGQLLRLLPFDSNIIKHMEKAQQCNGKMTLASIEIGKCHDEVSFTRKSFKFDTFKYFPVFFEFHFSRIFHSQPMQTTFLVIATRRSNHLFAFEFESVWQAIGKGCSVKPIANRNQCRIVLIAKQNQNWFVIHFWFDKRILLIGWCSAYLLKMMLPFYRSSS